MLTNIPLVCGLIFALAAALQLVLQRKNIMLMLGPLMGSDACGQTLPFVRMRALPSVPLYLIRRTERALKNKFPS